MSASLACSRFPAGSTAEQIPAGPAAAAVGASCLARRRGNRPARARTRSCAWKSCTARADEAARNKAQGTKKTSKEHYIGYHAGTAPLQLGTDTECEGGGSSGDEDIIPYDSD